MCSRARMREGSGRKYLSKLDSQSAEEYAACMACASTEAKALTDSLGPFLFSANCKTPSHQWNPVIREISGLLSSPKFFLNKKAFPLRRFRTRTSLNSPYEY